MISGTHDQSAAVWSEQKLSTLDLSWQLDWRGLLATGQVPRAKSPSFRQYEDRFAIWTDSQSLNSRPQVNLAELVPANWVPKTQKTVPSGGDRSFAIGT